ncbi:MAG: hypothetical protein AB4040_21670 [Synechococcus sp.]
MNATQGNASTDYEDCVWKTATGFVLEIWLAVEDATAIDPQAFT